MKVLVVHNLYRSRVPSGENAVYHAEVELLRQHGHEVITFERNNDDLDRASKAALLFRHAPEIVWSRRAQTELRELAERERPDIAHFHNIFPQISPAGWAGCREAGVPVVQTVHNYRFACANGLFFRDGRICEECLDFGPSRAARYRCYNDSWLQTALVAAGQKRMRRSGALDLVDAFIALTDFARRKLAQIGLPEDRTHVKPNFLEEPSGLTPTQGDSLVFLGKLDVYKGIATLMQAHREHMPDVPLHVIGTGPLESEVAGAGGAVTHHGLLPLDEALKILAGARALVMPSTWYETFGRTTMEAFALGKPVIASDLGCMAELVKDGENGLLFPPDDPAGLAAACRRVLEDADLAAKLGRAARTTYETSFTAERNYEQLMAIYEAVG